MANRILKTEYEIGMVGLGVMGRNLLLNMADQVEAAWQIIMPVLDTWPGKPPANFPNYAAGTWGPEEANRLFNTGHHWPLPTEIIEK